MSGHPRNPSFVGRRSPAAFVVLAFLACPAELAADTTPPENPSVLSSPSHDVDAWSNDPTVDVECSGAADGDGIGIAGYSVSFDRDPEGVPDTTVDVAHGTDPHTFTSPPLPTAQDHWLHLRTCDVDGICTSTVHLGPLWVDTTVPENPTSLTSPDHLPSVWSNDPTVDLEWSGASDGESGLAGYSVEVDEIDPAGPPEHRRSWGSLGAGDGQFNRLRGIAVDGLGNVYVTDTSNDRIQKFDSSGNLLFKWGSPGTGDGQFSSPVDVAVDGAGHVYVSEHNNHRVQKFDSSGNFLLKWGSFGSGDGQLRNPSAVAVDGNGNVHVADRENHRVQKFDSTGAFLSRWGLFGSGDGQLTSPHGVTVDGVGNVYVADSFNHRVQKFDSSGNFLLKWGSGGTGDGQFISPFGVAADRAGNLYVADTSNHRVQRFDSSGTFVSKWGSNGAGDGQFDSPQSLAVDRFGNFYVADTLNHRVQVFRPIALPDETVDISHSTDPHTFASPPLPDGDSHFFHLRTCDTVGNCSGAVHRGPFWIDTTAPVGPSDLASTSHDNIGLTRLRRIEMAWTPGSDALSGLDGYAYEFNQSSTPSCDQGKDLEEDATAVSSDRLPDGSWWFHLCPVDHAGNWTAAQSVGPFQIEAMAPSDPTSLVSLSHLPSVWSNDPTVDVEWSGATDSGSGVAGYSAAFDEVTPGGAPTFLSQWGSAGSGAGEFASPFLLAVDRDGNVYVADFGNHRIQRFDPAGNYLLSWGSSGSGDGELALPQGVAVDAAGHVYVADTDNHRIQKFDASGNFLSKWGSFGSGAGQFAFPVGVAVSESGQVYVADNNNHRIQKFDVSGTFLSQWGSNGSGEGEFDFPIGVAVNAIGDVYVSDPGNRRIQKFDASGAFLGKWGSSGTGDGQFEDGPFGVAVDDAGRIYAVDVGNHRVQVFDIGGTLLLKWGSAGMGNGQFTSLRGVAVGPSGVVYTSEWNSEVTRIQTFAPSGQPDETLEIPHTVDPHAYTGPALSDGDSHFFHLRTCDHAGNCSGGVDLGPFWIDTTEPAVPTNVASTSHTVGLTTRLRYLDMTWTPGSDALSGLDGYAYELSNLSAPTCDLVKDLEEDATTVSIGPLADGSWWFHLCAVDNAGNWTATQSVGPFRIDAMAPSDPTSLVSLSHLPSVWSNDPTVDLEWSGAVDAASGVAGYSVAFDEADPTGPSTFLTKWGSQGSADGQLDSPILVTTDEDGNVYVADFFNHRIQKFDRAGTFLMALGSLGTGDGQLTRPQDVAVDAAGCIYVADTHNHRIQKFDRSGVFLASWGSSGSGPGQFVFPAGIAVNVSSSRIYVVDNDNTRVQVFDSSGAFVSQWGSPGHGDGQFGSSIGPLGIAVDGTGAVFVADPDNRRIQKFDASGAFLAKWGSNGTGEGQFMIGPWGVAVDAMGNVYAADVGNDRIQKFDPTGNFLTEWGSAGTGDGEFTSLRGVAVGPSGIVYTSDSDSVVTRIQAFAPSGQPDETLEIPHTVDPHAHSSSALSEGDSHFFHLRTCDHADNCSGGVHLGPFWIDTTAPAVPADVASSSHVPGTPTVAQVIDMTWTAAADARSGLDGYAYELNGTPTPACDEVKDLEGDTTAVSSAPLADGSWWFHLCAVDEADNWTAAVTAGPFIVDTSAPTLPSMLQSTSHDVSTWSILHQITVEWSGADDGSGVAGYSIVFDRNATTVPDGVVDLPHGSKPHEVTGPSLADGGDHFFHLRACDTTGNCSAALHLGPFWIDQTAPTNPAIVESTSHTVGTPSNDTTIEMRWSPAVDATSGVSGYAYELSSSATPTCDETLDLEETETAVASDELADGDWFFHLCTVDNAGNWTSAVTTGPYPIDTTHPQISAVDSVASAGPGGLSAFSGPLTHILLTFDEEMDATEVSDPGNYLLVEGGADGQVTTAACGPLDGDDQALAFAQAHYDPPLGTVRLFPVGAQALALGVYRIFACATLTDVSGNALDGNGDGNGDGSGDDFSRDFEIQLTDELLNPNFDADLSDWTPESPLPSEIGFSTEDADDATSSGSVAVANLSAANAVFAVGQCVAIPPFLQWEMRGFFRIDPATTGIPRFSTTAAFYVTPDCTGTPLEVQDGPVHFGDTDGIWTRFAVTGFNSVVGSVRSVRVRFRLGSGGEPHLRAGFDALHLGQTLILFEDGFESGNSTAWSSTEASP